MTQVTDERRFEGVRGLFSVRSTLGRDLPGDGCVDAGTALVAREVPRVGREDDPGPLFPVALSSLLAAVVAP
jgi:hypothetical protein